MRTSDKQLVDQVFSEQVVAGGEVRNLEARRSDLSGWRMWDSRVAGLKLVESRFNYCWSDGCRLEGLSYDHCLCEHGSYSRCQWDKFSATSSFFTAGHFSGCSFTQSGIGLNSFGLCVFEDTAFRHSRMSEVSFIGSVWRDCVLEDEDYFFVRFPSAIFIRTVFSRCMLRKAIFRRARFIGCRFVSCQLPEAVFENAQFENTIFEDTDLRQAANLSGVQGVKI